MQTKKLKWLFTNQISFIWIKFGFMLLAKNIQAGNLQIFLEKLNGNW